jgi:uncharacterized UPF0146 family protein
VADINSKDSIKSNELKLIQSLDDIRNPEVKIFGSIHAII